MNGQGLKTLTPKQMFQRIQVALAQVKSGDTSEKLLNDIRKSYILWVGMFMNSKNSGTSDPHRVLLNLTDETAFKRSDK